MLILGSSLFGIANADEKSQQPIKMAKELAIFQPYLGTWESTFSFGEQTVTDVSKWERVLNGTALKTTHSINDGDYGGESIFFYDQKKKSLVFYYFTTAGFYTQGTVEILSDNSFVAFEDVTGNQDGITKVKSTSTMSQDKLTVATSYFKNGQWTKEEKRSYYRTDAKVIFK